MISQLFGHDSFIGNENIVALLLVECFGNLDVRILTFHVYDGNIARTILKKKKKNIVTSTQFVQFWRLG